jgi:anti-sigma factor RsiW
MFMKTFEEKWTAWLDGELRGKELAEFEASLPDRAAAEAERLEARKLGALLKDQLSARAMGNEEFFDHQLRERIERESPDESAVGRASRPRFSWTIGRLAWSGATALALFVVCAFFVMRSKEPADQSQYLSQILNARVDPGVSPYATVSMFQTKEDKVTVLWVDGLQSLPAEYAAK